jgi:hypothetical protein
MPVYEFDAKVEAPTLEEASAKMKAAAILMRKLKTAEIVKLAHVVEHEPVKTAMAKKALGV